MGESALVLWFTCMHVCACVLVRVRFDYRFTTASRIQPSGLLVSPAHPVYINGDWHHPCELVEPQECRIEHVFNFELDASSSPGHTVIANGVVCSTLGWGDGTDRLCNMIDGRGRELDRIFGRGWKDSEARKRLQVIV
jgi:hypothetical protein